jgi:hypothetical protein
VGQPTRAPTFFLRAEILSDKYVMSSEKPIRQTKCHPAYIMSVKGIRVDDKRAA